MKNEKYMMLRSVSNLSIANNNFFLRWMEKKID